jgi:hypothetical protein
VDDRLAQSRSHTVPLDRHRLFLSTPEMGGLERYRRSYSDRAGG